MAEDEVNDLRDVATQNIDDFIQQVIHNLQQFIEQENNVQTLQRAVTHLTALNRFITRPANFEGPIHPEAQANLEALRAEAITAINQFRNTQLPNIRNYVNLETNINNFQLVLNRIGAINELSNPADLEN